MSSSTNPFNRLQGNSIGHEENPDNSNSDESDRNIDIDTTDISTSTTSP